MGKSRTKYMSLLLPESIPPLAYWEVNYGNNPECPEQMEDETIAELYPPNEFYPDYNRMSISEYVELFTALWLCPNFWCNHTFRSSFDRMDYKAEAMCYCCEHIIEEHKYNKLG